MVLNSLRPYVQKYIDAIAATMNSFGLTPNMLSVSSLVLSFTAGLAYFYSMQTDYLLLLAFLFVCLSSCFDAVDGALARLRGDASLRGDFLDHVVDRYADVFIICGIIFAGHAPGVVGVLAITGILLSSYMGTQAQAVNLGRDYGGMLGRADRLMIVIILTPISYLHQSPVMGLTVFGWMLVFFAAAGHITALQRFMYSWRELSKKSD